MNTGNIKQFIGVAAISLLTACGSPTPDAVLLKPGVSRELAQFRKEHFKEVRYNLFFSIPESREEAVTGKADITLAIRERLPVIIDFRGESEQVASVLLNGRKVPYTVKDEHIVIDTREVANGENRVTIEFTANDQSLNRRDEFLYTLLVPDRARTLFPCFDQPDMKSLFTLSLEVPSSWQAVTNGAVEQVDSTSVARRKRISFRETEPLSTYLFSFVAGKLTRETYSRDGRNISIYHRETDPKKVAQCSDIASEVFDALEWQEEYTQIPYPFAKYDLIILPGFQFGGICLKELKRQASEGCFVMPNADGKGYGFFRLLEKDAKACLGNLPACKDEVLRGSLLITLYENLLNRTIPAELYMEAMLDYLPTENNSLLFSAALGYIGNCQRFYLADPEKLELVLWRIVTMAEQSQQRLQAFRQYRSIARSPEAVGKLYALWKDQKAPAGCSLSENDYISLSYGLAIQMPDKADEIVATQQARITNPDRKRQYAFISPSVSPQKEVRDSVFASLLVAENRRVEPWASAALSNLNCQLRQKEAVGYIRPALEALQEIQRTGDIFFPRDWVRALLSGHTSPEAKKEVDDFFAAHPDYPVLLSNKIRQQADHLYR